jgi:putative Holliday junction resolvase
VGCYRFRVRTLALDHGERRIGLAISDPSGSLAQPLETVEQERRRPEAVFERIEAIVTRLDVKQLVVGLPLNMNGSAGPAAAAARAFGEALAARTGLPVEFVDERWTSVEAERLMDRAGVSERRRRGKVDPVAAALILRTWLERRPR